MKSVCRILIVLMIAVICAAAFAMPAGAEPTVLPCTCIQLDGNYTDSVSSMEGLTDLNDQGVQDWNTYATSNAAQPVIVVDLGTVASVSKVGISPLSPDATFYPSDYTLSVSEDGNAWTEVYTQSDFVNTVNTEVLHEFAAINARYVKMSISKIASSGVTAMRCFMVYGEPVAQNDEADVPAVALPATCIEWGGTELWGVKESVVTDVWADACFSDSETPYVVLDLASVQRINRIVTWPVMASADYYGEDYTFEVSTDGVNYETVVSVTGDVNAMTERTYKFGTVSARYVKMNVSKYSMKTSGATFGLRGIFVYPSTQFNAANVQGNGDSLWGGDIKNVATREWSQAYFTNAAQPYVILDLGKARRVDCVVTWPIQAAKEFYGVDYTIETSVDGVNYEVVYTVTGDSNTATEREYRFDAVTARYVKMNVTTPGGGDPAVTFGLRGMFAYGRPLPGAVANGDFVAADNEMFTYYGRWTAGNDGSMTAGWGTSKLRFKFTGTKFDVYTDALDGTSMGAHTDGEYPIISRADEGIISFTFQNDGPHEVLLFTDTSSSKNCNVNIKGIMFDKGAEPGKTTLNKKTVEIIGDSISDGWFGVRTSPYITDMGMGWESVSLAYAGITLTDTHNWATGDTNKGLESMYFNATNSLTDTTPWTFPAESEPDYIYINIGTNDYGVGISDADFQKTYTKFLTALREKNPNARIFCISPYGGYYEGVFVHAMEQPIFNAVTERQLAGDTNVFYIDTKGLLTADTARNYLADDLHPAESQFDHFANWIIPRLKAVEEETAHSYSAIETEPASCGAAGYEIARCQNCGMTQKTVLNATGDHTYGEWTPCDDGKHHQKSCSCGDTVTGEHTVTTVPGSSASCTEPGKTDGTRCDVCNTVLSLGEDIPASGHAWGEWSQWTAGENGTHVRTRQCSTCQETENETQEAHFVIHVPAVPATPEENGNIEYWLCEVCGKHFSDEACTKEIREADTVTEFEGPAPTGDKVPLALLILLLAVSACAAAVLMLYGKKFRY